MRERTRVNGEGRQEKQYTRTATPFERQLDIISFYTDTGSMSRTLAKFYLQVTAQFSRSKARSIQRSVRKRITIEAHYASYRTRTLTRVARAGHSLTLSKDGEKTIVTWINMLRKDGVPVSSRMLKQTAASVAEVMKIPEGSFAASPSWHNGFLQRKRLSMRTRTRQDQATPAEADEVVRAFATRVSELLVTHSFDRIYNAD